MYQWSRRGHGRACGRVCGRKAGWGLKVFESTRRAAEIGHRSALMTPPLASLPNEIWESRASR
jgi:hypothetical protein